MRSRAYALDLNGESNVKQKPDTLIA